MSGSDRALFYYHATPQSALDYSPRNSDDDGLDNQMSSRNRQCGCLYQSLHCNNIAIGQVDKKYLANIFGNIDNMNITVLMCLTIES